VCYCTWCAALVVLDVVGSGCGALRCRVCSHPTTQRPTFCSTEHIFWARSLGSILHPIRTTKLTALTSKKQTAISFRHNNSRYPHTEARNGFLAFVRNPARTRNVLSPQCPGSPCGPPNFLFHKNPCYFLKAKRWGSAVNHSPPSSAKAKNKWR